jgi:hypothetical protein
VDGDFRKNCQRAGCYSKTVEPYSPWMNRAEGTIREHKCATRRAMVKSGSPKRLWDYCLELQSRIRSNVAHDIKTLEGQTAETLMLGETADILALCEFEWFQWIWYRDEKASFPNNSKARDIRHQPSHESCDELIIDVQHCCGVGGSFVLLMRALTIELPCDDMVVISV